MTEGRSAEQDARAWLSSIEAAVHDVGRAADPEAAIAAAGRLVRYGDHLVADLVAEARAAEPPVSWGRIGAALGITRQAANERFSSAGRQGAEARRYRRARRLEGR